jgi:hypothetical protein
MKIGKLIKKILALLTVLLTSFMVSCEKGEGYCAICEDINMVESDKRICAGSEKQLDREILMSWMFDHWSCEKE